ncbi:hypothetical protein BJX68DRAFT_257450 [Aspergillus pseudodeflectus]|uniref:LysM domain-containing protein n=1 Tax=Aspergillus pseudodeflectus TaxID=176178 RepID=A0ABR4JTN6_9EURO
MNKSAFRVPFRSVFTWLVLGASITRAQLHLFNQGTLPFSSECNSAMAAQLDCSVLETGGTMYTRDAELTVDILDGMCTEQCKASLKAYREAVEAACVHEEAALVYKPIVLPDYYITNYNQRCLRDSNGEYCSLKLQEADSVDHCDECNLWTFREKLDNGYFANDDLLEQYAYQTSSCGVTTIPPPTPSSVLLSSAPAPTARRRPCAGRRVPIQPGDTCDSFALAHNLSTYRLLIDNGLQSGCTDFPTEGSLCGLASRYGITITQFRTWNQVLNARCGNLDILVGHIACVGYPGEATSTENRYATKPAGGTAPAAAPAPANLAPGVNTNCAKYYQVKEGDYCAVIAMKNAIVINDFYFLNPGIDKNCTNLRPHYNYCVYPVGNIETYPGYAATSLPIATTLPLANGTRKDCKVYEDSKRGEIPCDWLRGVKSLLNFEDWNPSVVWWNCTLANNTRYCVSLWDPALEEDDEDEWDLDPPENAAPGSTEACY